MSGKLDFSKIKLILKLYLEGYSSHKIAHKLNIGKTTVLNYLKLNKIKRRTNKEIKLDKTYEEIYGLEKTVKIKQIKKNKVESAFIYCDICNVQILRKSYAQKYCKGCSNKIIRLNNSNYLRRYRKKYPNRRRAMLRAFRKKLRNNSCFLCDSTKNLHFHHTNYEKDEGITLCVKCHSLIHKRMREKR